MSVRRPSIGLLAPYLKLYDRVVPQWRAELESFAGRVAGEFIARGINVHGPRVCRVAAEYGAAVVKIEREGVDCLVTLHLAYSPSLEAAGCLVRSRLPILMLDTTMDREFGRNTAPERINYNHGIHGVMDLASVLRRRKRGFRIVAGHVDDPKLWKRAVIEVTAAAAAQELGGTRALRVGGNFKGMGDFQVGERQLRALGIRVETMTVRELAGVQFRPKPGEVRAEVALDRERFDCSGLSPGAHERSVRAGLALRSALKKGGFNAFSMNFGAFAAGEREIDTVPFLEASKAMSRGVGYAGEGDVLTAALVGALARSFGKATFTEVFCPDWAGNTLFISHMGEVNPDVAAGRPRLVEKDLAFTGTRPPVILTCAPAAGSAVFANLAPGPDGRFGVIAAAVEVAGDTERDDMRAIVRGWIGPNLPVEDFLESYSRAGGTHHSALVLGREPAALEAFAGFAGLEYVEIGPRGGGASGAAGGAI